MCRVSHSGTADLAVAPELGHRRQHLGEAATGPMDPKLLDLTLGVKIPVTPGSKPVFSRGKLGEKLHRPSGSFDLGDPLGRRMSNEYNSLHDPHLQAYHQRKDNVQWLKRQGLVTSDGNVVCSLKEFNQYRQYRTMLKLEAEKASIREQSVAELTGSQRSLRVEIADLRAAAANTSSINEALAVEKVQLNNLVLQVEQENEVVSEKVAELERARVCEQEQLSWCERTKAELCAEKAQLEQLLQEAEEQQEGLRVQLRRLAEEKEETQEQLSEVSRQQESASTGLEQLRQESSRQGLALAKVCEEKEVLVQEKAALELRLAAVERDRQGLSEQLAEARPVKETLERSLFEAQQRVSQLEIARSQLEMRLHIVTQAKEVIQGEVKCLQRELEAERSLLRQERENAAQQLLRREQQHDDTLRLRQSGHEAEIQRLLQDLARAREGHQSELQELLERWQQEKAETEREHEKQLLDMEQKVAAVQAQQQEEQTRRENAERELGHRRQHLGEAATGPMDPKLLDLTLGVKIPVTPGSKPVFSRGKLGEKLHRPSGSFDLGDPLGRRMSNEYNSLHDPHLQAYHQRKDNVQWLKRQGLVASDGNVVCSLKEFNQYRQYRTTLKLEAEKASIREQEKPPRHLPKLEHAPKLTGEMDTSRLGQRLLLPQKPSCLGQRLLLPQKPSCPPPPKGENNSMKWGRRLSVHAALGKGQSPPQPELGHKGAAGALTAAEPPENSLLRRRQQIEQVAEELIAPVLESWEKRFPSGQAETAASDKAPSRALLDRLAREVINCICCTLEAFVTCQCEQGDLCQYSGILELLREELYKNSRSHRRSPAEGQAWMKAKDSPGQLKSKAWSPGNEQDRPPKEMERRAVPLRMRSPARARSSPDCGQPVGGEPQQPRQQRGR
ncbi:hypothetical protein Q9966_009351 [Columba livia]|nr:hypothetical protein Q9966_009351 [Columba livia]